MPQPPKPDFTAALFVQFNDLRLLRGALLRHVNAIEELKVTVVFTAERPDAYGLISQPGIEGFVADDVLILRNILADERRRRTMNALDMRGMLAGRPRSSSTREEDGEGE